LKLSHMMPEIRPLLCKVTYETNTRVSDIQYRHVHMKKAGLA